MLAVQTRAYSIFNFTLAGADALLAAAYLILANFSILGPDQLLGTSPLTAILASIHIFYILFVFPFLRRRSAIGSSLIGSSLFSLNLIILIVATGSFESPYYAFWLLLLLAIGIYRPAVPLGFLAVTTIYFLGIAFSKEFRADFFTHNFVALITTYITGALGFWLWHTHHTKMRGTSKTETIADKLSQEQLKSEILIRGIADGVVVVDAASRVQLLNPAAEALCGWPEAEAKNLDYRLVLKLGQEDDPFKGGDDPFEFAFSEKKSVIRDDVVLNSRNNKSLPLSLLVSPIFSESGEVKAGIGVFRDISKEKAEERRHDEFISTASHEMRTPVAAIEGYVSLALNPKVSQIDQNAQNYLTKAQASAKHLGKLFQDLLSTTKLDEGKLPNHPEIFDINGLVQISLEELRMKAEAKKLSLGLVSSPVSQGGKSIQPLYYVNADPERIREVLTNLIDNAIKFSNQGEVTATISGDELTTTIGVHDQGLGIAPEDLPHMFQKFYRVDSSQTRSIGGTGLGLYICRTIIELYNGRMWVESKPSEGSHFYFRLPRVSTAKALQLSSISAGKDSSKSETLVAPSSKNAVR